MIKKNDTTFSLAELESVRIQNILLKKYNLECDADMEVTIEKTLTDTLLAREVAIYAHTNVFEYTRSALEENTFYIVELPVGNKLVEISLGLIRTRADKKAELSYGYIYR